MNEFNIFFWLAEKMGLEEYANPLALSVIGSLLVLIFITIVSLLAWSRFKDPEKLIIPSYKISLTNIIELTTDLLTDLMRGILGDKTEKYFPLIATLFIYILICNLIGFIPGFLPPTAVITTNLACALIVFFYYNYLGFKKYGFIGYMKKFMGPLVWLAPLLFIVELVSHVSRIISLSVRLYGNMLGDHLVLEEFADLVPLLIPILFMAFGIFISFLQAFIFSILSTVYIALATQDE